MKIEYFSIFGFAALFSIFPRYGIYESKCIDSTKGNKQLNNTGSTKEKCLDQVDQYEVSLNAYEMEFISNSDF